MKAMITRRERRLAQRIVHDAKYRAANRHARAAARRRWELDNPEKECARRARWRASYRGACTNALHSVRKAAGRYATGPVCTWAQFWEWANSDGNKEEWEFLVAKALASGKRSDRPSLDRLSKHRQVGGVPGNLRWAARGDVASKCVLQKFHGPSAVSPYHMKDTQISCV